MSDVILTIFSVVSEFWFCQRNREAMRTDATAAWLGIKSNAIVIKRKSSKKNRGEVAPPVEKIRRRQMEFRMTVETMSRFLWSVCRENILEAK